MARDTPPAGGQPTGSSPDLSAVIGRHVRAFRLAQGDTLRSLATRSGLSVGFLSQLERGQTSIGLTTLRDLALCLGHEIVEFFDEQILAGPAPLPDHTTRGPRDAPGRRDQNTAAQNTAVGSAAAQNTAAQNTVPGNAVPGNAAPPADSADLAENTASDGTPPDTPDRHFTLTRRSGEHTSQYISGLRTYRMLSQRASGLVLEPMLVEIAPGGRIGEPEVHHGEEFAYVVSGELTFTVAGTCHRLGPGDSLHLKSTIPHQLHNDTDDVVVVVSVITPRLF